MVGYVRVDGLSHMPADGRRCLYAATLVLGMFVNGSTPSVGLWLTMSVDGFKLSLGMRVWCVCIGLYVDGITVTIALCGRDALSGVRHGIKFGNLFWLYMSGRISENQFIKYIELTVLHTPWLILRYVLVPSFFSGLCRLLRRLTMTLSLSGHRGPGEV